MKKFGIIICSRTDSARLPNKPFLKANGRNLIEYLLANCIDTGVQTFLAVPREQYDFYKKNIKHKIDLSITPGVKDDPLRRMYNVAHYNQLDHIIRVCHDKIFIDHRQVHEFINRYMDRNLDYIYSTNFIDGMSFEIFSYHALFRAQMEFSNVEHISFAIDAVTDNRKKENFQHFTRNRNWLDRKWPDNKLRLLIDHEKDYENICEIVEKLNGIIDIDVVLRTIDKEKPRKNSQPFFTFYTCSYNDFEHLPETIESVLCQTFRDFEYILVDDGSTDPRVLETMHKYAHKDKRIRIIRNETNLGLSTSSNVAVYSALGKYCMRLDADDYLLENTVLADFLKKADHCHADVIYPDYMRDGRQCQGNLGHHVGGAMFRKRVLDYMRFTDGLRHFDSNDIYKRAVQLRVKIDYWPVATFNYRNRKGSLSNSLIPDRLAVKEKLEKGLSGESLLCEK